MSSMREFDEKYLMVMKDIETAVIAYYKQQPDLTDHDMDRIYASLNRVYKAEKHGSASPVIRLSDLDQPLYDQIKLICEWWLGRGTPVPNHYGPVPDPKTIDDMLIVLRRLSKSVTFWTKDGGRQGYLHYVQQFIK